MAIVRNNKQWIKETLMEKKKKRQLEQKNHGTLAITN
jgi:hypothetical protein